MQTTLHGEQLRLSRFNHRLPRREAYPTIMERTAAFHHESTDGLLPEAHPVCDDATALDTPMGMCQRGVPRSTPSFATLSWHVTQKSVADAGVEGGVEGGLSSAAQLSYDGPRTERGCGLSERKAYAVAGVEPCAGLSAPHACTPSGRTRACASSVCHVLTGCGLSG